MGDDGFNDLLENVIFLFVGAFAGSLADAERRQRVLAQAAAAQLAVSNAQLQTQAALAERMRASIGVGKRKARTASNIRWPCVTLGQQHGCARCHCQVLASLKSTDASRAVRVAISRGG